MTSVLDKTNVATFPSEDAEQDEYEDRIQAAESDAIAFELSPDDVAVGQILGWGVSALGVLGHGPSQR